MAKLRYKTQAGEVVQGVTTIIGSNLGWNKNVLIAWARKQAMAGKDPTEIKEKAGNIGTLAHLLCESDAKGITPDLKDYPKEHIETANKCFLSYTEWKKRNNIVEITSEISLVSEEFKYGGTIDMLYKVDGKWILADIKTSSGVYVDHKIQVAAYAELCREHGYDIVEVWILHLRKDGTFQDYKFTDLKKYWEIFKLLLNLNKFKGIE